MKAIIQASKIYGTITAPPSKSISHRALITAALSGGVSAINNLSDCQDVLLTVRGLKELGADITLIKNTARISRGQLLRSHNRKCRIDCGDSGTSARFLTAVASVSKKKVIINGSRRLRERPMSELIRLIRLNSGNIREIKTPGHLPLAISPGQLSGGDFSVNLHDSSQTLSALLLVSPFMEKTLSLIIKGNHSMPYADLTVEIMKTFGIEIRREKNRLTVSCLQNYRARKISVEGDYSGAAYFFAAAMLTGSSITVTNLPNNSGQADRKFLEIAHEMGASVRLKSGNGVEVSAGDGKLKGMSLKMGDCPDLVPTVAVLAGKTAGPLEITDIGHLKHKESNRIICLAENLEKMGLRTKKTADSLTVFPGILKGTRLCSFQDHRLTMAFTVAGLAAEGETTIEGAASVNKSYPGFFPDMQKAGGKVRRVS